MNAYNGEFYKDLDNLADNLKAELQDKNVMITGTKNNNLSFYLAHVIRNYANRTYCIDESYKMTNDGKNYRIIEDDKVVLIKANIDTERKEVYNIINRIHPEDNISLEIIINGAKYE